MKTERSTATLPVGSKHVTGQWRDYLFRRADIGSGIKGGA